MSEGNNFLVFVDTNIFLDLYRIPNEQVAIQFLSLLDDQKDKMIISSHVEMEYKKNRQRVMIDLLEKIDHVNDELTVPVILSETEPVLEIRDFQEKIIEQQHRVREIIKNLLRYPGKHDRVYQLLEKIFRHRSVYNFHLDHPERKEVMDAALFKFTGGFPPRKGKETAIGDAVSWEWVIRCSERSGKDVVIVSRDTDFGTIYNGESFLNDWLMKEFAERTEKKRRIILTNRLGYAFQLIEASVNNEMLEEEMKILN